jgi:phage gpG-like protein
MIRAGVEIRGEKEVDAAFKFFIKDVQTSLKAAVQATALEALTDVRRSMKETPKTGREYPRRKDGSKTHIASSEGNPPAVDFGTLTGSTYYTMVNDLTAAIGSRLEYAYHLEFGTLKMGARPSWVPAAEKASPKLEKRLRRVIAEAKARAEKKTK